MILLLACSAKPPISERIAAATVVESCQVCIFQRDGELGSILKRLLRDAPVEEVEFGHCFACLSCPGEEGISECQGFSPADLNAAEYPPQPGRLYNDTDETWTRVDCRPVLPGQAERLWRYAQTYPDLNPYQVINKKGRSCLGFCEDIASAIDMPPAHWAGNLTVPGAMRFPDATLSLSASTGQTPLEFTDALVGP